MLRSGSICVSFLYNYLMTGTQPNGINDTFENKVTKLQCLSNTLRDYGGVLSKLSQILSLDDQNNTVFSECKPFSQEETTKYFKKYTEESPYDLQVSTFNVYKSGSVGQVYKAVYRGVPIILKVQYVGLMEQTQVDLDMLDTITSYVYYFVDMKHAMSDIKTSMYEELDYKKEARNQQLISDLYRDCDYVEIPEIIPELSTDKVLAMNFIKGRSLSEFIANSTQLEKNNLGKCIVQFVFESLYKHGILYSDAHYGNILVKDDNTLCVLDYGCLHIVDPDLLQNIKELHRSVKSGNVEAFYAIVERMGIIGDKVSEESKEYMYEYFCLQYSPWTLDEFEFTESWLKMADEKNTVLMNQWTLPQNMVYFNKIPFGMYHILTKLKLRGSFSEYFDKLLT